MVTWDTGKCGILANAVVTSCPLSDPVLLISRKVLSVKPTHRQHRGRTASWNAMFDTAQTEVATVE
jgi:hypothetical protein